MSINDKILGVIENIYANLDQPPNWDHLLSTLSQLTGCTAVTLDVFGFSPQSIHYSAMLGMDPNVDAKYLEHYSASDYKVSRALALGGYGVRRDSELLTASELKYSPAYNELWRPNHLDNQLHCFSTFENDSAVAISLMTGNKREPFDAETIKLCETLLPHITRAIRIQANLENANALHSAKSDALQALNLGIAIVDSNGQIIFLNDIGEKICTDKDGLYYSASKLCAMGSNQSQTYNRILRNAILVAQGIENKAHMDSMCVKRPSGKQPYLLSVTPVSNQDSFLGWKNARAIIRITDPEQESSTRLKNLKHVFQLTPAEAKLVEQLMVGKSLNEIAEEFGIAIGTARNQLKSVFQKTQTNGQVPLISLMLRTLG